MATGFLILALSRPNALRPIGLRRPEFYNDLEINLGVSSTSLGFYNDCFMRNASDAGTFTRLKSDYTDYFDLYPSSVLSSVDAAKSFMQSKAHNGSQGGETCPSSPTGSEDWQNAGAVVQRLDADGFHYLHGSHAPGFRPAMVTADKWDTIKSRLGYRFHAKQVTYPGSASAGAPITVSVDIENSGFAKIPYDRTAYFVLSGPANYVVGASNPKAGTHTQLTPTSQSNESVRSWTDGTTMTFSQTFPAPSAPGTYGIRLYVPDTDCVGNSFCDDTTKKNYEVKLATLRNGLPVFDAVNGTNDLGVSLTVTGGAACAGGGNLLQNCDFSNGTTGWQCGVNSAASATCSVVSGEHVTTITNPGTATYHVQPNQRNLSLVTGTTYTVSFDARSSVANRPITVSVSMNHTPFSTYSGVRTFTLATSMTPQTFNFTMTDPSDSNVKLELGFGANGSNTVVLDNVVLRPSGG